MAHPTTPVGSTSELAPTAAAPARKPAKRSVLDLVSGGPHGSLCRMIKKCGAASVLEIGVGDGSRAAAVLAALLKPQPEADLKYIAIDLFEMGDGPLTVKDFHQQVRTIGITPNLVPMPCQQGLTRVAHTHGAIDLILIADPKVDTCDPLLQRVTKATSLVLRWDGQSWQQIDVNKSQSRKAA